MRNLASKILLVMNEIGAIEKKKAPKDSGISYAFQGWDDVRAGLRDACVRHRLVVIPSVSTYSLERIEKAQKTDQYQWSVSINFTIIDPDSGETMESSWAGEARDTSDKGLQKAFTSGMKYWLLKTFQIADRETTENDEAPAPESGEEPKKSPEPKAETNNGAPSESVVKHLKRLIPGGDSEEHKVQATAGRKSIWDDCQKYFGSDASKIISGSDSYEELVNQIDAKKHGVKNGSH